MTFRLPRQGCCTSIVSTSYSEGTHPIGFVSPPSILVAKEQITQPFLIPDSFLSLRTPYSAIQDDEKRATSPRVQKTPIEIAESRYGGRNLEDFTTSLYSMRSDLRQTDYRYQYSVPLNKSKGCFQREHVQNFMKNFSLPQIHHHLSARDDDVAFYSFKYCSTTSRE